MSDLPAIKSGFYRFFNNFPICRQRLHGEKRNVIILITFIDILIEQQLLFKIMVIANSFVLTKNKFQF